MNFAHCLCILSLALFWSCKSAPEMPWKDPDYSKDIPATQAVSRENEKGWNLWIPHHKDRVRWVTEKPVDLLMVGDSITFTWSRQGKKIWDQYYGNRNAVNIGSSGDNTAHMLWHFQNGGLAGMKERNPKLVVLLMGTNNRGEPAKKGADTAYGILALLKEIHSQLPNSKILLLAIFPRGMKADDTGRVRNNEINDIIRNYADEKTVYWLDLAPSFLNSDGTLKKELMPDGLHPNEEGFKVWAEAMEPTLKKLLGEK